MFAFSEKGNIPTDEECKNQILTGCEDSQSKRCRTSVLTRTWAKRLHLLKALGLTAELLVIILSKVCKQRYQAHKRRSHEERWLKDRQDSSVSTKLEVRLELTHNHLSHRRFSTYSEGFMKQTLKGSCSVVNMQAFKKTQRTPLYLLYATEEVWNIQNSAVYLQAAKQNWSEIVFFFNPIINLPTLPQASS